MAEREIHHVADVKKSSIFRMVDADGDGVINEREFGKIHDMIVKLRAEEKEHEDGLVRKTVSLKRNLKLLMGAIGVITCVLGLSVIGNFVLTQHVIEVSARISDGCTRCPPLTRLLATS